MKIKTRNYLLFIHTSPWPFAEGGGEVGGYQVFPFLPSDTRDGKYFSFGHSIKPDMRQCQRKGNILSRES